jgi:hypothetical protein
MPYAVARFVKGTNEIYGRSPAMRCLPEIKCLNKMDNTILKGAEMAVLPPWFVPDDGSSQYNYRMTPGSVNFYKSTNPNSKPEPMRTGGDIGLGIELLTRKEQKITKAFYNDLFEILAQRKQNMTATEVLERVEEKLDSFAPTLGRLMTELFTPAIERCVGIMARAGEYPPPPPVLLDYPDYEIEYISKLALAVKKLQTKGFLETMDIVGLMAQNKPEILDNFDFDKVAQGVSKFNGVPNDWLRPEKQVNEIRETRAEAQAQAAQAQMMKEAAETLPALQKETEKNSPLDALMKGVA